MTTLFLLKLREDYSLSSSYSYSGQIATGMYNSALFAKNALVNAGKDALLTICQDANSIHSAILASSASIVIIEGLWVTPTKMLELQSIHQDVRFIIRIHSDISFIASEGIFFDWFSQYVLIPNVIISPNSVRMMEHLLALSDCASIPFIEKLVYLPNIYPTDFQAVVSKQVGQAIKIGCFGANRLLKNILLQASLAIRFAKAQGKKLEFHVNADTSGTNPQYKNLVGLFSGLSADYKLIEHSWEDRPTFLQTLQEMDMVLQLSFSETFNIVAADATYVGIPVLASSDIKWSSSTCSSLTETTEALAKMNTILAVPQLFVGESRYRLKKFSDQSLIIWLDRLNAMGQ